LAKEQGLIDAVGPLAKDLVKVGLYLKPDLIAKTLELAGEGTLGEIK
jgi:predicted nucleic acid-binding protein